MTMPEYIAVAADLAFIMFVGCLIYWGLVNK